MTTKVKIVQHILASAQDRMQERGVGSAPVNIALIKYWGKRDAELNLPVTSSFSLTLPVGSHTTIQCTSTRDSAIINGVQVASNDLFQTRLSNYLDLFRPTPQTFFHVDTTNEVPTAAGLASSASGFAALVFALDSLFGWQLPKQKLSILARMASGSACRSIFTGFVEWHKGERSDGQDSFATPVDAEWKDLRIGLHIVDAKKKAVNSRDAMIRTVTTSTLYATWPTQVAQDLVALKRALQERDFCTFGQIAENNALAMHATMIAARPSILYWNVNSLHAMHAVWELRRQNLPIFFTMDAGPNLKLLFEERYQAQVKEAFSGIQIMPIRHA